MGSTHVPPGPAKGSDEVPRAIAWVGRDRLRPTHLRAMLQYLLQREAEDWEPLTFDYINGEGCEVGVSSREGAVWWQGVVCRRLGWAPETGFTAASLLDRLLHRVRIPPRYLQAVAAAATFIAAKLHEEDENVPSTIDVVERGGMECSHRELLRMERVLLDKLLWHPKPSLVLDFLQVLHALAITSAPTHAAHQRSESPTRQLQQLTDQLWRVVCSGRSGSVRPAVLSLAVLSLHLDTSAEPGLTPWLQALTQVSEQELGSVRALVCDILGVSRVKRKRKPSEPHHDDDMYADIKKLYASDRNASDKRPRQKAIEEIEESYVDIKRLYASPAPPTATSDGPVVKVCGNKASATLAKKHSGAKKKTKPTFKAKTKVKNFKQALKFPCKISLIKTKKIFEDMMDDDEEDEEEEEMEVEVEGEEGPLVEPVGILNSPIFSPMSPEFPDIRNVVIKTENLSWQQKALEVSEQVYRPMTYAQVLRLHLTPLTRALGV